MSRLRVLALAAILVLLVGAVLLGRSVQDDEPVASAQTQGLRRAAALEPCPSSLGPALPDVTVRCLGDGSDVRLRGPATLGPAVVNVWGSWCPPCLEEIPDFIRFAEAARGRVAVIGVNTVDTDDSALSYAASVGMRYPSVVDEDEEISQLFGKGTPKTLFLDATGAIRHVQPGKISYTQLQSLVTEHLGVRV